MPNFETDDFANDKEIQKIRKEQEKQDKIISDSISVVSKQLSLEKVSHKNMKHFLMFHSQINPIVRNSFKSNNENFPLRVSLVEYYSSYRTAKGGSSGTDLYFFGMISLNKTYPLTYCYQETIREKMVDLFVKGDVDFKEHKKFSSQFHLITKDEEKLRILLLNKPLDDLAAFPEMEAEINENLCLFRVSRKPVSEKQAIEFSQLANLICKILG